MHIKDKRKKARKVSPGHFSPIRVRPIRLPWAWGIWAPGQTAQLHTPHLGVRSWPEGKSPLEGKVRQLPLEGCQRGSLSC